MFDVNPLGLMLQLKEIERAAAPYLRLSENRGCTFRALLEAAVRTFGGSTRGLAWRMRPTNQPDSLATLKH